MAGFGKTAEAQKEVAKVKQVAPVPVKDAFAHLRAEREKMKGETLQHLFVGLAGFDGTGKSGIVKHAFDKACEKDSTLELHSLDFDMGMVMLNSAVDTNENIVAWKPWQMGVSDRTAYDYPGTHQRVMDIMKFILEEAESGNANVWGVHVSGLDSWLEICTNNMRIIDLGLAKDGIESADIRGAGDAKRVERQSDWAIRNTRFHQLTALSRSLVRAGVRVFWETHLRLTNYSWGSSEDIAPKWRPDWEKASNNFVYQILICERNDTLDDETGDVIKSQYTVTFEKSKTSAKLQGQKRTTLVTEAGKEPQWYGLPELYDGTL